MYISKLIILFFLFCFSLRIHAKAFCVGTECNFFPDTLLIGLNVADPFIENLYTDNLLFAMSGSAVLNNINSSMSSPRKLSGSEIGLGYSMARTNSTEKNILFDYSELAKLPRQGIALTSAVNFGSNLAFLFQSNNSTLKQWNINLHFFPYTFNEIQIPFVQIKNINVNGRVFNSSVTLRYFPKLPRWNLFGTSIYIDGISSGIGLYHTNQNVHLDSYDRTSFPLNISGESRKWLGVNELNYFSEIYTGLFDLRGGLSFRNFFLFTGMGLTTNYSNSNLKFQRTAAISNSSSDSDFVSRATITKLHLDGAVTQSYSLWFAMIGLEVKVSSVKMLFEILKNDRFESANIGMKYEF